MNQIRLFVLASLISSCAFAGSLKLDLRSDFDSTDYNAAAQPTVSSAASSSNKPNQVYTMTQGRLDFNNKLNDQLSYRLRLRFIVPSVTTGGPDKLASDVDYAYINHKMDAAGLTFGKLPVELGGFEVAMPDPEYYFSSEANKAISSGYKNGNVSYFFPAKYGSGLKVALAAGDFDLTLVTANNPDGEAAASPKPQTRPMTGAIARGKFLEKTVTAQASYHQMSMGEDSARFDDLSKVYYINAGLKYDNGAYHIQYDYNDVRSNGIIDTVGFGANASVDNRIISHVLDTGYKIDNITPKLKLESSNVRFIPNTSKDVTRDFIGGGVALEYRPFGTDEFRYHVAVTSKSTKQESTDDKVENHAVVGVRLLADFLK